MDFNLEFELAKPTVSCENEKLRRITLSECKHAATVLKWKYKDIEGITDHVEEEKPGHINFPHGCYVGTNNGKQGLFFNHKAKGIPNASSRSVCKAQLTAPHINGGYIVQYILLKLDAT